MLRIASTLVLLTACTVASAQNISSNDSPLRAQFSYIKGNTNLEVGANSAEIADTSLQTTINYKFAEKFYAEVGYGKSSDDSMSINGSSAPLSNDTTTSTMLGLGYLRPKSNKIGEYWGIGFQTVSSDIDDADDLNVLKILSQKNTSQRFGEISFQRATSDSGSINSLAGTHIWFIQPGMGLGFEWSLSGAKLDEESFGAEGELSQQAAGIVFMYRP